MLHLFSLLNIVTKRVVQLGLLLGLLLLLSPLVLWTLGYKINAHSDELAEIAAKNKNVMICTKIINIGLLGPSSGESRMHCIKRYAELTKDPSACELLMPSSYGLSCTGAAKDFKRPCALGNDRSVSGNGMDATLAECVQGTAEEQMASCCTIAKARFITSFNDCSGLDENQDIKDQCYYSLAFKNHDPESCASIQHENLKKACIVDASALKKNPSICSGCTPPVTLEQVMNFPQE